MTPRQGYGDPCRRCRTPPRGERHRRLPPATETRPLRSRAALSGSRARLRPAWLSSQQICLVHCSPLVVVEWCVARTAVHYATGIVAQRANEMQASLCSLRQPGPLTPETLLTTMRSLHATCIGSCIVRDIVDTNGSQDRLAPGSRSVGSPVAGVERDAAPRV